MAYILFFLAFLSFMLIAYTRRLALTKKEAMVTAKLEKWKKEYWLADPEEKEVEVLMLKEENYENLRVFRGGSFESSPLRGLRVYLRDIFEPLQRPRRAPLGGQASS